MPIQQVQGDFYGVNIFILMNLLIALALLTVSAIAIYFLYKRKHHTPFKGVIWIFLSLLFATAVNFAVSMFVTHNFQLVLLAVVFILAVLMIVVLIKSFPEAIHIKDPRSLENLIHMKTQELAGTHQQLSSAIEQKEKAEEEIKFLYNFQKAVQLSSIVSMTDRRGTIIYVNENFEKISGFTKEELLGQNHRIINSGHHEKSFWTNMWKTIAQRQIWRDEVKNKTKDGGYYWVDTFIIPFVDDDGRITRFLSIRNDITRRKNAEYQLKQLNDDLERKIVEKTKDLQVMNDELVKINFLMESVQKHVHLGVWEIDMETQQSYWSDELYSIFESPYHGSLSIEESLDRFHTDDREKIKKAMDTAIEEGVSWDLEVRLNTFGNNEIWVRTTGVPIVEDGKTKRLKGLLQNIDRQKRSEEQLKNSQSIINLAIEAGEIGVFKWDIAQGKLEWNKYMHQHFGWPEEKFMGTIEDFLDRVHPEDMARVEDSIRYDFDKKSKYQINYRVVLESGQINFIEATGLLTRDVEGRSVEMTGICLNMTEKKETENLLREKEEQFRLALENSATGMALQTLDGRWIKVNNAFLNIIGYEEQEIPDITAQSITHPDDLDKDAEYQGKLIHDEIKSYQLEKRYIHKKGSDIWVQINKSLVRDETGKPLYFISQIQDITRRRTADMEIKRMNEILEAHAEKLESTNRELESFTYSVSHDLRAPLRSINGYAQILKEDYAQKLDSEGNEVIDVVIRNAQRMGQLIDDLLEFSRIGRKEVAKGIVDMPSLVESISGELIEQEKDRVIELKVHPLEKVKADMQMIRQVWINLISNAIKYTRNQEVANIEIGCKNGHEEVCYYIKDNGVGFNMKYINKLFEVFQRLHRNDEFEGTGVGLALVRRIINRHGGSIWAEAKENQGATFYFTIPKN